LQTNEIYVPNDVCLGREKDGVLLFGTNSVGKSSLIKSIGISLVMAQAGLFVPATEFKFKPYKMIMTRILGNDNIFKGLSTFIVEMTELKTILTMATKDSLVLGDEVCSGTESVSAISIFAAALMKLHDIRSTFIFATHFHEVIKLDAIKALDRMMLKHMKVTYNAETDALEYVRVMCDGVGDTNYGLEVCRSLNMPMDFLDVAYDVRKIVAPETKSLLESDGSRYNAGKIKHKCEMCGNIADEVHHLQEQQAADSRGFIGTFNKNHRANLSAVCEKCHDKIHLSVNSNKKPVKKTRTTNGYKLSS
jgi:DNA mismatch repair protein MutS